MAITSTANRIQYTGNGATTAYSLPYLTYLSSHVEVYLDGFIQASGYTVTGMGGASGVTVTFTTAPASGVSIVLQRVVPFKQESVISATGPFPAKTVEKALDYEMMTMQQLDTRLDRAAVLSDTATYTGTLIVPDPAVTGNQGKFLRVVAGGLDVAVPTTGTFNDPMTTKGDLLGRDATTTVRVAVGSDGQTLESDSAASPGVSWKQGLRNLVTTAGDLLVATASGVMARLGVGGKGALLVGTPTATEKVSWQAAGANDSLIAYDSTQTTGIKAVTPLESVLGDSPDPRYPHYIPFM